MLAFIVACYFILYYVRPGEWVPGLGEFFLLRIFGIAALLFLAIGAASNRYQNLSRGTVERYFYCFFVAVILSHVSHTYVEGAINSFNVFLPSITGFCLVITFIDSRVRHKNFLLILIGLTVFLAYEGLRQHATGFAHGGMEPVYQNDIDLEGVETIIQRIRWYGVFNDPNDFGLALILVVPFLFNMLLDRQYVIPLLALPAIAKAIYYTNSRGTVLAGLVAIVSYFIIRYRSAKGALIGATVASMLFVLGPSRLAMISVNEESANERIEAWYEAYQMFKSNPIFGVGQGMFTDFHYITAHNSFVLVMAELGFVGLFFFTALFYCAYYWLWKNVLKKNDKQFSRSDMGLISASYASLTGVMSAMFFLSRAYIMLPYMLLAMAIALTRIIGIEVQHTDDTVSINLYHLRNVFFLTISQIILINIFVKISL